MVTTVAAGVCAIFGGAGDRQRCQRSHRDVQDVVEVPRYLSLARSCVFFLCVHRAEPPPLLSIVGVVLVAVAVHRVVVLHGCCGCCGDSWGGFSRVVHDEQGLVRLLLLLFRARARFIA